MAPYLIFGALFLYVLIRGGIQQDRENRKRRPGTPEHEAEWVRRTLAPYAGIEKD